MTKQVYSGPVPDPGARASAGTPGALPVRLDSKDLFRQAREVEIAHEGRVYRLRLTQLNKLILTA